MDCQTARELILESLTETGRAVEAPELEVHLAGCKACRGFSDTQFRLDLQLSATISAPALSPAFRTSLAKRVRREPLWAWPEFLPDVAHVAGCMCATALCLALLPFPPAQVTLAALGFTLATYFVQSVIRSSLEQWQEGWQ
jgi:predicted anti-sigma-YlaC factor YlaD